MIFFLGPTLGIQTKEPDKDNLMLMEPTSSPWPKTTERKYSMTSPNQEWMEMEGKGRRGHSWWQLQYHLLLTNSLHCFTYNLALVRTGGVLRGV